MTYKRMVQGFGEFKTQYFETNDSLYQKLVKEGQKPSTLIIACSDSRIDPAILTQSDPGDFFAIRNVAALIPPHSYGGLLRGTSSAIEYAVRVLEVQHIIVLGHSGCGGVAALSEDDFTASGDNQFEFLNHWLGIGLETKNKIDVQVSDEYDKISILEQGTIVSSLNNLLSFPWIREKYNNKTIDIHGWYFKMNEGVLLEYRKELGQFEDIQSTTLSSDQTSIPSKDWVDHFIRCCRT